MQVVPPALLEFSRSVFRTCFSSILNKQIFTLAFERSSSLDARLLRKLERAAERGAIVVTTPASIKVMCLSLVKI